MSDGLPRKINRAVQLIRGGMEQSPLSAICWSGGKDSMVLLHLMTRRLGYKLPVVFFREPWQPFKYEFHDRIIRDWGLHVLSWHPSEVAYQQTGGEIELQNWYRLGPLTITCPTGIVEPAPAESRAPWTCGLELHRRPTQERLDVYPHYQALWLGHKRCDTDAVLGGDAGTRIEARVNPDGSAFYLPLRDWSHEDIWSYIEAYRVPYDQQRYEKVDGRWRERPDRRHNADYVHACTLCIDRREEAPRFVECPKTGMTIENVSARLPWVEPRKLSYMEDDLQDVSADAA